MHATTLPLTNPPRTSSTVRESCIAEALTVKLSRRFCWTRSADPKDGIQSHGSILPCKPVSPKIFDLQRSLNLHVSGVSLGHARYGACYQIYVHAISEAEARSLFETSKQRFC